MKDAAGEMSLMNFEARGTEEPAELGFQASDLLSD